MNILKGSIVQFGSYAQTPNRQAEPLLWRVLDIKSDRVLLVSLKVTDTFDFATDPIAAFWGESKVRDYLNEEFLNKAFSDNEKEAILPFRLEPGRFILQRRKNSPVVDDRIVLLNSDEVLEYFSDEKDLICHGTDLALSSFYPYYTRKKAIVWALRNPGNDCRRIATVSEYGVIDPDTNTSCSYLLGLRPAMWLDISTAQSAVVEKFSRFNRPMPSLYNLNDNQKAIKHMLHEIKTGDTVEFGHYGQSKNPDADPIVWQVLEVTSGRALLISRDCLKKSAYNLYSSTKCSWHDSFLRYHLNTDFLVHAFTEEQRCMIAITERTSSGDIIHTADTKPGSADCLFILSQNEALKYFEYESDRCAKYSKTALENKSEQIGSWWLCDTGFASDSSFYGASFVSEDGQIYEKFKEVTANCGVRPALWLKL